MRLLNLGLCGKVERVTTSEILTRPMFGIKFLEKIIVFF